MSSIAIDRKRLPENVIATYMIPPLVKQFKLEMNLPKMMTYMKKATIKASFIIRVVYITIY